MGPTYNGSTSVVVDKRIQATKESYYGMGRSWRSNIGLQTKRVAFKNLVVNTMLSGMEPENLRDCDIERMEKVVMILARKVVGQTGCTCMRGSSGSTVISTLGTFSG